MATCLPLRQSRRGIHRMVVRVVQRLSGRHNRNKDESFRTLVQASAFSQIQEKLEIGSGSYYYYYSSQKRHFQTNKHKIQWLYKDMYEQGPLHFILPYRPPLAVVEQILFCTADFSHVPEEALDSKGRTPLHIAAAFNCSFQIIRRLLSGVSLVVPALTRDDMDRLPLHWACCHPFLPGRAESENKFDTIILLLDAYPQAVDMEDANGRTPLDYALQNRILDKRITDLLQKVSIRQREQQYHHSKHPAGYPRNSRTRQGRPTNQTANSNAIADPNNNEEHSSFSGYGVPSEINAARIQRGPRLRSNYVGSGNGSSVGDDISSLGWDRASIATATGRAPTPTTAPAPSNNNSNKVSAPAPTNGVANNTTTNSNSNPTNSNENDNPNEMNAAPNNADEKNHKNRSLPRRVAKSIVKGYFRRWSPRQNKQDATSQDTNNNENEPPQTPSPPQLAELTGSSNPPKIT